MGQRDIEIRDAVADLEEVPVVGGGGGGGDGGGKGNGSPYC